MLWGKEWTGRPAVATTVSNEGFLDIVKKFFGPKIVRDKRLSGNIRINEEVKGIVKKYLTNPKWVEENLKEEAVNLPMKDMRWLTINGHVPQSPKQALDFYKRRAEDGWNKNHAAAIKFFKESEEIQKEIEQFYEKMYTKDAAEVERFALSKIEQVKIPKLWKPSTNRWVHEQEQLSLPKLTAEQIAEAAPLLLLCFDWVTHIEKSIPPYMGGGDFTENFWEDHPGYAGTDLRTGYVGDFFYEQGVPDEILTPTTGPTYELELCAASVLDWIAQATGIVPGREIKK